MNKKRPLLAKLLLLHILTLCPATIMADDNIVKTDFYNSNDTTNIDMPQEVLPAMEGPFQAELIKDGHTVKEGFLKQMWSGIVNGNVDHTFDRPIDLSIAVAPAYSQESSFGLGGSVSALFRINKSDSLMQPSDFSLIAGGSINGNYTCGVSGNIHITRDHRIKYRGLFKHQRRDFWGVSFFDCDTLPTIKYECARIIVDVDYMQRFAGNWFWGAALRLNYANSDIEDNRYLAGQDKKGFFTGAGLLLQYDSRDFILNPSRGLHFLLRSIYYPKALNTFKTDVVCTTMQFNAYHKLWRDAILAYDLFSEFNSSPKLVPWQLREEICALDCQMRGYYAGRYMDNNQIAAQVELRQHIWKRLGAVAWTGAGTFFNHINDITGKQILSTYGAGIRFEMKHRTNVRLDFAFGRNSNSIIFNYGEAF